MSALGSSSSYQEFQRYGMTYTLDRSEGGETPNNRLSEVIEIVSKFAEFIQTNYRSSLSNEQTRILKSLFHSDSHFSVEQIRFVLNTMQDPENCFITSGSSEYQISREQLCILDAYLVDIENIPTKLEYLTKLCLSPITLCYKHPCSSVSVAIISLTAIGNATGFWWRIQGMEPPK